MNHEKYKDPTAEYAIAEAEKWERQQKRLEEKHGIKRGDIIQIVSYKPVMLLVTGRSSPKR